MTDALDTWAAEPVPGWPAAADPARRETATARVGIPTRVLVLVLPVCIAGAAALGLAAGAYARLPHSARDLAALLVFLAAVGVAERFPVPVDGLDSGGVTLGCVFSIAAILLLGWEAGVLVAAGGLAASHLAVRRPLPRVAYNASMFALAALAAGLAIEPLHGDSLATLLARLLICTVVYNWVVGLALLSAVLAAQSGRPFWTVVAENARRTSALFALMASASLMLVVLWQRSPVLSVALVGPLLAISLYQRSTFRAMRAMRLALTDTLTGLGNHRNFHERLQRELTAAEREHGMLSVCLVDIDDFKQINDRFGHPVGDVVLGQVASRLRQGGESFRLGGDEFAVLLPGLDEPSAVAVAQSIVERIGMLAVDDVGSVTVSAGVATYPAQGVARDELIRLADSALYWAKEDGKNQVRTYEPVPLDVIALDALADSPDLTARYRAAASLAKAVDARDAYGHSHSERVAETAVRIARRLGVDELQVELTRLAASLHDIGKLAIPEEILRKPAALNETERLVLERHPQIGYGMLESLGIDAIADCVLHHHERWDGSGYPNGLAGDEIPLGARIIFAADAFDAMTAEHVYREPLSEGEALAELHRCSGTQFDPEIVLALSRELGVEAEAVAV